MTPGLLPGRWEGDTEAPDTCVHLDYVSQGKMRTRTSVHTHTPILPTIINTTHVHIHTVQIHTPTQTHTDYIVKIKKYESKTCK